jgi:hypothetical protein
MSSRFVVVSVRSDSALAMIRAAGSNAQSRERKCSHRVVRHPSSIANHPPLVLSPMPFQRNSDTLVRQPALLLTFPVDYLVVIQSCCWPVT